jgi:NADH:ubiquinone oxidoreductase subunit H
MGRAKVVARFQDRLSQPYRTLGIFQLFADIIKLLIKEDTTRMGRMFLFSTCTDPITGICSPFMGVLPFAEVVGWGRPQCCPAYIVAAGASARSQSSWRAGHPITALVGHTMVANMISYEIPMVVILHSGDPDQFDEHADDIPGSK